MAVFRSCSWVSGLKHRLTWCYRLMQLCVQGFISDYISIYSVQWCQCSPCMDVCSWFIFCAVWCYDWPLLYLICRFSLLMFITVLLFYHCCFSLWNSAEQPLQFLQSVHSQFTFLLGFVLFCFLKEKMISPAPRVWSSAVQPRGKTHLILRLMRSGIPRDT